MQQEPATLIATRLIRYTHLLDLRASCYAAIEAQRKIIEHDGQTSSHSLSLHSLQQQAQQIEIELTELGSVDFRQDLIKLDSAAKVVLSLETQFGEAIDRDEEIGGVDAVDSIVDLLLGQGRPTLEVLGLREAPFWKAAAEFGYRVHRGHEVDGAELEGKYWWSLYREDWVEVETSESVFDSYEAAWQNAMCALANELKSECPET